MTTSNRQLISDFPQPSREPDGSLVARVEGSARQYYFFNILGSTQLVAPASENNPTDRIYYTPWGEIVSSGARASIIATTNNPYRYVGQLGYYFHQQDINDQFQGWMQLGVRFYNPVIGRFERRDPANDTISHYNYTEGRQMVYVDPTGLWTEAYCQRTLNSCNRYVFGEAAKCAKSTGLLYGRNTLITQTICLLACKKLPHLLGKYCMKICRGRMFALTTACQMYDVYSCTIYTNALSSGCQDAYRWCSEHADDTSLDPDE